MVKHKQDKLQGIERTKLLKCDFCENTFSDNNNLKTHIKNIHSDEGKRQNCSQCKLTFANTTNLKRHLKTIHEGKKDFQCGFCPKNYAAKCDLKRHEMNVHAGDTIEEKNQSIQVHLIK